MDMSLIKLQELVMDREAWHAAWGHKELDMAEQLNWTKVKKMKIIPTSFSGHSDMKQKESDKIYKYVNTEKNTLKNH